MESNDFVYIPPRKDDANLSLEDQIHIEINEAILSLQTKFPNYLFSIDFAEVHFDPTPAEPIILNDLWLENMKSIVNKER